MILQKSYAPMILKVLKSKQAEYILKNLINILKNKYHLQLKQLYRVKPLKNQSEKQKRAATKQNLSIATLNDFSDCIKRVKTRVLNGGHNVEEEEITRRYYRSIINFWKYKDLADKWSLFYNGEKYSPTLVAYKFHMYCDIIDKEKYNQFLKITELSKMLENSKGNENAKQLK